MTYKRMAGMIVMAIVPLAIPSVALADYLVFQQLPTNPSFRISHHAVGGPVLADDFIPAFAGTITKVEWWGSAATSNDWEIVFHTNRFADPLNPASGEPNIDDPNTGGLRKYVPVLAAGVADVPGWPTIFHYTTTLPALDLNRLPLLSVSPGMDLWFSVANFNDGWTWADALNGPTLGGELFNAHVSVGSTPCRDGGPHCGAWADVHTDLAFRITAVPEPSSWLLLGTSLIGIVALARWRSRCN